MIARAIEWMLNVAPGYPPCAGMSEDGAAGLDTIALLRHGPQSLVQWQYRVGGVKR